MIILYVSHMKSNHIYIYKYIFLILFFNIIIFNANDAFLMEIKNYTRVFSTFNHKILIHCYIIIIILLHLLCYYYYFILLRYNNCYSIM